MVANIIFLDAPVGTGFSYARSREGYNTSDILFATHTCDFLRKWLIDHLKFLDNPLYIGGDSYSGLMSMMTKNSAIPYAHRASLISDEIYEMATDSFSVETHVGEASIGSVYRAQLDDGKVLAVKKINSSALPNHLSEDFMDIVSDVSRLRHPNITELVGSCSEHGQHLLVYVTPSK
ncbi:unnamed protein product [Camellia sinensis]